MKTLYTKELTLELMDKVIEELKKKNTNNFSLTIIGDFDKVTKVMKDFNKSISDSLNKYKI